jgi:hypothetical protein
MEASPASATTKQYVFLLGLLLAVRFYGYSGDHSGNFARSRKKDGVV